MLKNDRNFGVNLPARTDSTMLSNPYKMQTSIAKATLSKYAEAANRQNSYNELINQRAKEKTSPIKGNLMEIPLNQYDSVTVNSRFDDIKRKYDCQLKRIQQSQNISPYPTHSIRKESEIVAPQDRSPEIKLHGISRSTWETKDVQRTCESIMGSASKQREMDILADQVNEIRRSIRIDETQRVRSRSRNTSSFVSDAPNFGQTTNRVSEDPRVESIDKINSKIKQILNCLGENDMLYTGKSSSIPEATNKQMFEVTYRNKDLVRQLDNARQQRAVDLKIAKPDVRITESFIANSEDKLILKHEQKQEARRYSMYLQKGAAERVQRGHSSFTMRNQFPLEKRTENVMKKSNDDYILKSGKDVDEEIRKIQQKIRRSEEQRKKLNIRFEASKANELHVPDKISVTPIVVPSSTFQNKISQKYNIAARAATNPNTAKKPNVDESPSFKKLPANDNIRPREGLRSAIQKQTLATTTSTSAFMIPTGSSSKPTVAPSTSAFREDTTRVYANRRATIDISKSSKGSFKNELEKKSGGIETKRLVERLKQQVTYDEDLRNSKLNFAALSDNTKWEKLGDELKKRGISFTEAQLKTQFELSVDEHNPFYSVRQVVEPTESVATKYASASDHWKRQICKNFDSKAFANEGFKAEKIDLERKGYLTVQDFVRFLNIQSGKFFRNRDLVLIFRRIGAQSRISFDDLINTLCR